MTSSKFRALAAALLLSTATAASVALLSSTPVAAATVRPQVGQALQAAIKDANAGQGSSAMAKIHEAESVSGLTSSEQQVIAQTKEYVAAKTGQGATGAKVKFANDYNAGRYSAVVGEDADALRKSGAMDGQSAVIVAQAYYLMHDYDSCIRHIRDLGHVGQSTLELLNRCAYEAHDEQTQQTALEQLVVDYNQTKYWSDLLSSADRTGGMTTGDTLDVYRLRFLSGTMRPAPATDYETATEIAVQLGFPSEAALYAQKGIDTKALDATRGAKLLNLAKIADRCRCGCAAEDTGRRQRRQERRRTGQARPGFLGYGQVSGCGVGDQSRYRQRCEQSGRSADPSRDGLYGIAPARSRSAGVEGGLQIRRARDADNRPPLVDLRPHATVRF